MPAHRKNAKYYSIFTLVYGNYGIHICIRIQMHTFRLAVIADHYLERIPSSLYIQDALHIRIRPVLQRLQSTHGFSLNGRSS